MSSQEVQNLSFRRPTNEPKTPKAALAARHTGILQDQLRRYNPAPDLVSSCLSLLQGPTTTMGSILLARCAPSLPGADIWCDVLQHQRLRRRSEHTRFAAMVLIPSDSQSLISGNHCISWTRVMDSRPGNCRQHMPLEVGHTFSSTISLLVLGS
jgi:hypothetical protein